MSTKKNIRKIGAKIAQSTTIVNNESASISFSNFIPLFFGLLYLVVHFLPSFGSLDAFGSQWLYVVCIDFITLLYIILNKKEYHTVSNSVITNIFSEIYFCFFILAGLSIFIAINPTEALVCFVRIIATIVAFVNLSILFQGRVHLFKWLAQLLGLILLVESFQTISQFFSGADDISFDALILSLKGTTGNKNIFAADLAIKIPFVIYCIHTFKIWGRLFNISILFLSLFTLFIINARASYVSLFLILISYFSFLLFTFQKEKKILETIFRMAYIFTPLLIALLFSQFEIATKKNLQPQTETITKYGTVTERVATIYSIENNKGRIQFWNDAIDYTMKHPIIGCGIGNWKIASIPYEKSLYNDGTVSMHVHNDFLENFAELGIFGGLLYLGLFVCIFFFTFHVLRSDTSEETKQISFFTFLSFIGYTIDAFFNFPFERPITQVLFALIVALNVNSFIDAKKISKTEFDPSKKNFLAKNIFGLVVFLLLVPAIYVTYQTYKSLVAQNTIIADHENQPLRLTWNEVVPVLPSIPNLSVMAQPLDAIKARYLIEADKNEEALVYLKKASKANPYFGYAEFLKAGIYAKMDKMDSAYTNARDAFYKRPRAIPRYQTLIAVLAKMKDTLHIHQAFTEVRKYRNEPYAWNLYLMGMLQVKIKGDEKLLRLSDSALQLFPGNGDLIARKNEIAYTMGMQNGIQQNRLADKNKEQSYFTEGVANFNLASSLSNQNNFEASNEKNRLAIKYFLLAAETNPNNFAYYENAGLAYLNMKNFANALVYLKKALSLKSATDGKTEYFSGIALLNLGKKEEGCTYLQTSLSLGWKEAAVTINSNCK